MSPGQGRIRVQTALATKERIMAQREYTTKQKKNKIAGKKTVHISITHRDEYVISEVVLTD